MTKLQHVDDKGRKERVRNVGKEEKGKVERGVQGAESCRGEGEGGVKVMEERERRGEIIGSHREAGVGEEVVHVHEDKGETYDEDVESSGRGEAEGRQKDREKQKKERLEEEDSGVTASSSDDAEVIIADNKVSSLSGLDVELLTNRLQEAQEETDRQAVVAQDLRSKLGEQSKKTWEAEQRLVVLESELQHLKKAAESLGDARRHIEVWEQMEEECLLKQVLKHTSSTMFSWLQ